MPLVITLAGVLARGFARAGDKEVCGDRGGNKLEDSVCCAAFDQTLLGGRRDWAPLAKGVVGKDGFPENL